MPTVPARQAIIKPRYGLFVDGTAQNGADHCGEMRPFPVWIAAKNHLGEHPVCRNDQPIVADHGIATPGIILVRQGRARIFIELGHLALAPGGDHVWEQKALGIAFVIGEWAITVIAIIGQHIGYIGGGIMVGGDHDAFGVGGALVIRQARP